MVFHRRTADAQLTKTKLKKNAIKDPKLPKLHTLTVLP